MHSAPDSAVPGCRLTAHALRRAAQRNLSVADIHYVLAHGALHYAAGAAIVYLRKADIPRPDRQEFGRLEGTAVVLTPDRTLIITVWRNRRRGARHIRRKHGQWWSMPEQAELPAAA
jgi:hypothetical protein